jgi:hypothetical protein
MAFAHVGDAFKSFLDLCSNREWVIEGKGRLGAREAMSKFFQEAVNTSSQALGLKERPIDVKISSRTPAQGDTLAVLVSVSSPGGNLLDNISFPFRYCYIPLLEYGSKNKDEPSENPRDNKYNEKEDMKMS